MIKKFFEFEHIFYVFLIIITIIFTSRLNSSFSLPKVLFLFFFSIICILYLILFYSGVNNFNYKKIWTIPFIFILIFLILAIGSKNIYLAFFGTYGRFSGFLFWFSLIIIMFTAAFTIKNSTKFINVLIFIGVISTLYGLLQVFNSNLSITSERYRVIGTLGNPNYVSALLGVSSTLIFWKIIKEKKIFNKFWFGIGLFLFLFVIVNTRSSQGIFIFIICVFFYIGSKIYLVNKKNGLMFFSIYLIFLIIGFFGILQKGPLRDLLYQYSITLRGDYWRTAIAMFDSDKFKGIGISRFGIEFQNFRDQTAALRTTATITDDPHNEILFFLSSGGLFLTLAYILVLLLVIGISIYGLRKSNHQNHENILILFTAWTGFRVESLISVNHITNNVVEWTIAGVLFNLSLGLTTTKSKNKQDSKLRISSIVLKLLSIVALVYIFTISIIFPKLLADSNFAEYNQNLNNRMSDETLLFKKSLILNAIAQEPSELIYRDAAARFMINTGDFQQAKKLTTSLIRIDSDYYSTYILQAIIFESYGAINSAEINRLKALDIDPYDLSNIDSLRKLYFKMGNSEKYESLTEYLTKLDSNFKK